MISPANLPDEMKRGAAVTVSEGERPAVSVNVPLEEFSMERAEKEIVRKLLTHFSGNKSKVAEVMGWSRYALYRRLTKWGIAHP